MKELKHIKSIKAIDDLIDLKNKKRETIKELKHVVGFENAKYSIVNSKEFSFEKRYHLLDTSNPSHPILYGVTPGEIKSYLNTRNVDLNTVHGKDLIFTKEELPENDEYKVYDDTIVNIDQTLATLKELRDSINYEYSLYRLGKYKIGNRVYYRLIDKETKDVLVDDIKSNINRYIDRHKIDRDQIFQVELLDT